MTETKTFRIKGMHCASCAGIIEKTLKKAEGVESVEVNYGTETAKVVFSGISAHELSQVSLAYRHPLEEASLLL